MPVYRYSHTCGFKQDFFLHTDKDSVITECERCGRRVSARQVRDKSAKYGNADGVTGVMRDGYAE